MALTLTRTRTLPHPLPNSHPNPNQVDCYAQPHADLGGEPLVPGPRNLLDSASACCEACRAHRTRGADGTRAPRSTDVTNETNERINVGSELYHRIWVEEGVRPKQA